MRVVREFPRSVRVVENEWIPLSDGTRLGARIWMPEDAHRDPVPAILEYIPYRKRDLTRGRDEPVHAYTAGHGRLREAGGVETGDAPGSPAPAAAAGREPGGGPRGGGRARDRAVTVRSPLTTGTAAGDWCAFGSEGEMPGDQREDDGRSAVFDSPPLEGRLEILGAPRAVLELSADRPVAMVAARLAELFPDGASLRVTYGLLDLTHREGRARPRPLEPGRRYRVEVRLDDVAHAFGAGSRLRLAVSSSYWPVAWPSPETAALTLRPGGCRLLIPVRPLRPGDGQLRPFGPPEAASSLDHSVLRPDRFGRTLERDVATGRTVCRVASDWSGYQDAGVARIEAIDLDVGHTIRQEYRAHPRDAGAAEPEVHQRIPLRGGSWDVRVESRVRLGCGPSAFRMEADLSAEEGGEEVFSRHWNPVIPRDGV